MLEKQQDVEERPLSPSEVAAKMRTSTKTVIGWINRGELPAYRLGGRWFIEPEALRRVRGLGEAAGD